MTELRDVRTAFLKEAMWHGTLAAGASREGVPIPTGYRRWTICCAHDAR